MAHGQTKLPGSREKTSGIILRIVASAPLIPNRRHAVSTAMASCRIYTVTRITMVATSCFAGVAHSTALHTA